MVTWWALLQHTHIIIGMKGVSLEAYLFNTYLFCLLSCIRIVTPQLCMWFFVIVCMYSKRDIVKTLYIYTTCDIACNYTHRVSNYVSISINHDAMLFFSQATAISSFAVQSITIVPPVKAPCRDYHLCSFIHV